MNEFGKLIYSLRKEKGWTQAELADKTGVTNQAVSKWETGESFPETSALVLLSEIFGVSVDDLLKGRSSIANEETTASTAFHVHELVEKRKKEKQPWERFGGIIFLASLTVFLLLGFIRGLWHPGWIAFPIGYGVTGIIKVVDAIVRKTEKLKKILDALVSVAAVVSYVLLGVIAEIWHPTWIIFIVSVFIHIVIDEIFKLKK